MLSVFAVIAENNRVYFCYWNFKFTFKSADEQWYFACPTYSLIRKCH